MYYYITPLNLGLSIYSCNNTERIMRFNLTIESCAYTKGTKKVISLTR